MGRSAASVSRYTARVRPQLSARARSTSHQRRGATGRCSPRASVSSSAEHHAADLAAQRIAREQEHRALQHHHQQQRDGAVG